jgi:succinate-semialdehyde dehydrogenase/glutarate-semialdehyde dehydrogenase
MAFQSVNPATGEVEATFPSHTAEEVEARLALATKTFSSYRHTAFEERAHWMVAAAELYEGELPDIASVLSREMGKTFASAKGEVAKCAMAMRWFAEHAERLLQEERIETAARASYVRYEPLGPVLAVMPWNFPLWQVVRFAAPALMAGNVGLLKHASNVPQAALLLEDVFRRAGFPPGAFSTLLIGAGDVGDVIRDERVVAVTLTGSEAAGRSVASIAGASIKKCVLELGGSDPFIVLAAADFDRAVRTAVQARVQNNGQSCIAAKRFIIEDSIYDRFAATYTDAMASLRMGDPFDPATELGPLVSETQREEIAGLVEDARAKGATVGCGGTVPEGPGWFYPATVLSGVTPEMRVFSEEVFGPVAVLERARDLTHALELANSTTFGLGSSVWTEDADEQRRCIEGIEAGQVFVNALVASTPELPFGGIKRSGFGRELSFLGIREFCNAKSVWVT